MNVELMERVRQLILMRPELHDQQYWLIARSSTSAAEMSRTAENGDICNTTACVAGWAAVLSAPPGVRILGTDVYLVNGTLVEIEDYAQKQLGLTDEQCEFLFNSSSTREEVLQLLKWLPDHPDAGIDEIEDELAE